MSKPTPSFRRRIGSFFMELAGASSQAAPRLDRSLRQAARQRAQEVE